MRAFKKQGICMIFCGVTRQMAYNLTYKKRAQIRKILRRRGKEKMH